MLLRSGHGEHNYPEEFTFSAALQQAVERDQVLPTQGHCSLQGTGMGREKKVQEGFVQGEIPHFPF